jgi:hypothetical protein
LLRDPITCPKCDAVFTPQVVLKSRPRTPGYGKTAISAPFVDQAPEESGNVDEVEDGESKPDVDEDGADDDQGIEDAADLPDDDDPVADIGHDIDKE